MVNFQMAMAKLGTKLSSHADGVALKIISNKDIFLRSFEVVIMDSDSFGTLIVPMNSF